VLGGREVGRTSVQTIAGMSRLAFPETRAPLYSGSASTDVIDAPTLRTKVFNNGPPHQRVTILSMMQHHRTCQRRRSDQLGYRIHRRYTGSFLGHRNQLRRRICDANADDFVRSAALDVVQISEQSPARIIADGSAKNRPIELEFVDFSNRVN
jgi:hypothetical protein